MLLLDILAFHGLSDHALSVLGNSLLLEVLEQLWAKIAIQSVCQHSEMKQMRQTAGVIPESHSSS